MRPNRSELDDLSGRSSKAIRLGSSPWSEGVLALATHHQDPGRPAGKRVFHTVRTVGDCRQVRQFAPRVRLPPESGGFLLPRRPRPMACPAPSPVSPLTLRSKCSRLPSRFALKAAQSTWNRSRPDIPPEESFLKSAYAFATAAQVVIKAGSPSTWEKSDRPLLRDSTLFIPVQPGKLTTSATFPRRREPQEVLALEDELAIKCSSPSTAPGAYPCRWLASPFCSSVRSACA